MNGKEAPRICDHKLRQDPQGNPRVILEGYSGSRHYVC